MELLSQLIDIVLHLDQHLTLLIGQYGVWGGAYYRGPWGAVQLWYGDCAGFGQKLGTLGSLLEISQVALVNIQSNDLALISHERCKLKSFSSSACACINDELARPGIEQ